MAKQMLAYISGKWQEVKVLEDNPKHYIVKIVETGETRKAWELREIIIEETEQEQIFWFCFGCMAKWYTEGTESKCCPCCGGGDVTKQR